MPTRKGDISIGYRAWTEAYRLFPDATNKKICKTIGCGKCVVEQWGKGVNPSAKHLARLHELGADVIWILTGRRK